MKDFFEPVRGQNENAVSLFLSFMAILFAWTFLAALFVIVPSIIWQLNPKPWQMLFIALFSFVPIAPTFILISKILGRKVLTFITINSKLSIRKFFIGAGTWAILLFVGTLISFLVDKQSIEYVFNWQGFLAALLVIVVLLPVQVLSEELVFRGFIPQAISFFKIPKNLVVLLSSLAFAVPHLMNPEAKDDPLWSLLAYGALGFAWLTAAKWFGGIEVTFGAHLVNNFYGLALVGYQNSVLNSSPIFIGPSPQMNSTAIAMWITVGIWLLIIKKFRKN